MQSQHHQLELTHTRHDSKNWVGSARRFLQAQHPDKALACLDSMVECFRAPQQSSQKGLRIRLTQMRTAWDGDCRCPVQLMIAVSPAVEEHLSCADLVLSLCDNLVRNALRATRQGAVRLQLWRQSEGIAVHVADTGPGFSHSTDHSGDGWGLGLAIIREQIERAGGQLSIRSNAGVCGYAWLPNSD